MRREKKGMNGRMKFGMFLAFAALAAAARAATPDEQGFIRDWILSGPWPSYQVKDRGQGLETDFLNLEDEAAPHPGKRETAEFVADWGILMAGIGSTNEWGFKTNTVFDATWTPLHADAGIIRLDGRFAPIDDYFVAYAVCYIDAPEERAARLAVGSDDDHKVWLDLDLVGKATSSQDIIPGSFRYDVTLPKGRSRLLFKLQDRTGGCGFCVQLTDREGKPMRDVSIALDPRGTATTLAARLAERRSPERLKARLAAAKAAAAKARETLVEERAKEAALSNVCEKAAQDLREAYAAREAKYAAQHAAAAARGRPSVSEPFEPCARRSVLCLNGDWEASADGGKTWGRAHVPSLQLPGYFYTWQYPVKGEGKPRPGFEKDINPVNCARKALYRTSFDWDGTSDLVLRCDAVLDSKATFSVNGVACGTWAGDRGIVRIPLAGLRKGANALEIAVEPETSIRSGIRGDVFLETLPKVRVDDIWVKTSWRKSALGAKIDLVNRSADGVTATVASYAVRDGRVRFRLPEKSVAIPAGGAATVKAQDVWSDPLTWGIGGRFGEPNLYTLVTDVRVGGALVDRHEVEFGFREFWICHTDFFLNGRRIFLQGDVGHLFVKDKRRREIAWPLYRADGINIIRVHDSDQWSITAARDADRMGMAIYAQMYPKLSEPGVPHSPTNFAPFEAWTATRTHRENLAAYTRWWKDLRNHPSVLIWSTDNEILTQAWDSEAKAPFNVRNDRIGALYSDYMNTLDRSLVVTRNGDVGTWNHQARWFQDPPCPTANYHYPNWNNEACAVNWQTTYEYRPIVFGEALYCSYLLPSDKGGWVGGRPKLVKNKAETVAKCVSLYTALEIPCAVYMGLGLDGFTFLDETGRGNPWGIKESEIEAFRANGTLPPGRRVDQYPWLRIDWPARSGEGEREPADQVSCRTWGTQAMNVYEAGVPSHVRNAVNDAYRQALRPQPPVDAGRFAEAIVTVEPWADVWTTTPSGNREGVRADAEGRAWFRSLAPGRRVFTCGGRSKEVELSARGEAVAKPGFEGIPRVSLLP